MVVSIIKIGINVGLARYKQELNRLKKFF